MGKWILVGVVVCLIYAFKVPGLKAFKLSGFAQGTTYHITYYASDGVVTAGQVDSIMAAIDSSLSIYKPYSLISKFNQSAEGIMVDRHFVNVVTKSLDTYNQTGGLFDITILPLMEAWGFGTGKTIPLNPDSLSIKAVKNCIGSEGLQLRTNFLSKKKPCLRIDVNGIAQGYSVDVVARFLEANGIRVYMVEIGGEVRVKGRKPDGEKMAIAIEAPPDNEFAEPSVGKIIRIENGALTTSGSYRRYYESGGKRIIHLIDPLTGYTVQNELISVTVYAADAITADAYDNAIMAMGLQQGLLFTSHRNDLSAYFIYRDESGKVKDTASLGFYRLMK